MKIKYLLATTILALPLISNAEEPKQYKGINIISVKEMGLPQAEQDKLLAEIQEQKTKGFLEVNDHEAQKMIYTAKLDEEKLKKISNKNDPTDTNLKKSIADVKVAFPFKGIKIDEKNIIGFAAMGTYLENGWTGISEYFKDKEFGVCSYKLLDMNLSKGATLIASEAVTYDVNSKPTLITIKGSNESGFIYNISWNDSNYGHILECANMKFDKSITSNLVAFAKKID
ncbi:MAG TPA: hypothetical protein VFU62_14090 [Hanamia sp.]|nr:hypothetical protein [Hanamia sp.]